MRDGSVRKRVEGHGLGHRAVGQQVPSMPVADHTHRDPGPAAELGAQADEQRPVAGAALEDAVHEERAAPTGGRGGGAEGA